VELDFDKANKEGSKETNPIGRVCNDIVDSGCYGRLSQESSIFDDFCRPFPFNIMFPRCRKFEFATHFGKVSSGKAKGS
jgi:hypothetical protein